MSLRDFTAESVSLRSELDNSMMSDLWRASLELIPLPIFVLTEGANILYSNRFARELLDRQNGIVYREGAFKPVFAEDRRKFKLQIERALANQHLVLPLLTSIQKSRSSGQYQVAIFSQNSDVGPSLRFAVALVIDPSVAVEGVCSAPLVDSYDLTPAEARLFKRMVHGNTIKEASAAEGIAIGTARKHLQQIFFKTGTESQAELMRLIFSGAGCFFASPVLSPLGTKSSPPVTPLVPL